MAKIFQLSEMMSHYLSIKENNKDCFVFYRLGDFYEMFFEDALQVSKLLDLTLTGRDCGLEQRAPMCGVPYHAVDTYISKLTKSGYKVAICEQLSQPGDQKGLLERGVVRIITPGTITDENSLDSLSNNYLLSVSLSIKSIGIAWTDISTGELNCRELDSAQKDQFIDLIVSLKPAEIIANKQAYEYINSLEYIKSGMLVKPQEYYEYSYDYENAVSSIVAFYNINNINSLGLSELKYAVSALGALLKYIEHTQKCNLSHFDYPKIIRSNSNMFLDLSTLRNLEILENLFDNKIKGSLLWVLDKTVTSMGAREIKKALTRPLNNELDINIKLDAVEELVKNDSLRADLNEALSKIRDIERLCNKISYNSINPRESFNIMLSLKQIKPIKLFLKNNKSLYLKNIYSNLNEVEDLVSLIENSLQDNPPISIKDGGVIKSGFNKILDQYRDAQINAKKWLSEYEQTERNLTDLKTLRIGYNRVFGYYLEVSKSYLNKVPDRYIRKQTLTTGERYITEELKNMEEIISNSMEKSIALEETIYNQIKSNLLKNVKLIQMNAKTLANLDVVLSFAEVSKSNNYVRPKIGVNNDEIIIKNGRHPVVESIKNKREFIPNDTTIKNDSKTLVITGPNMAGKSTYMRQVALIVIMAHIGCFVPCEMAEICLVDRVFTRVGASDNLAFGQSTFMVEMSEVANILNNATSNSLVILDEIGRGTSTLDGLSIAWALAEFISLKIKAKTMFATHYHELSELENLIDSVKNYHILIKDISGDIVFLYKIARGGANKSFGIEVASLAGVNKEVIKRSKIIMELLEESHDLKNITEKITSNATQYSVPTKQIGFFEIDNKYQEICDIINDIEVDNCTPIEALTILSNLKNMTKREKRKKK